jgi:hypothetical protein
VKKISLRKAILTLGLLAMTLTAFGQYQDGNTRAWGKINYDDDPWVFNTSRPNLVTKGLLDRHISIWASHGRYFDNNRSRWVWQRPNLFCTTEDMFTQTIVIPFLIPMLENAGATVFSPRERDWQIHEVIVDNDDSAKLPYYKEVNTGKDWKRCDSVGFAYHGETLQDGDNPFRKGTLRQIKATKKKRISEIDYQPEIPETGKYAVYVSYQTLPKSVKDAHYTVYHQGQATEFTVNQKMGGGTWVYLGSFDFSQGCSLANRVIVTNQSSQKGIVTADAVRFGGGMGNIARGGKVSGIPRCLEGARYSAQWSGAPYSVYSSRKGTDDYADDINTRSMMTNWLGGGSVYMPTLEGKNVPLELSLAVHSDAGFAPNGKDLVGSLAVCTTDFNDGVLSSGISRQTSKDLARALLENVTTDITKKYGKWSKRYLWDRNYSETRLPEIPSAILETLSHQNFPDVKLAQDPMFKFTLARSIYKTILRFISSNHGQDYVVEPLQPDNFSVTLEQKGKARLSWDGQTDPQEPSAAPTSYIIYVAKGEEGFDNGTIIQTNACEIQLLPNTPYRFKVTACNAGGESFPSETLSALYRPNSEGTILIVNGFHRLASPQVVDNDSLQGFDMTADPGVSYGMTAGWNGLQTCFDRNQIGKEGPGGLGYGGDEMVGHFVAGNDFDYPASHTEAIAAAGNYQVESCSEQAVTSGKVNIGNYPIVDLILGLEKFDGYTPEFYKTFPYSLRPILHSYLQHGGSLLVSGSYVGSDMTGEDEKTWLQDNLKLTYQPDSAADIQETVTGLGMNFAFWHLLNPKHYAATHPDIISPAGGAICAMQYSDGNSAAVAYHGNDYRCFTMGFPFECIKNAKDRNQIMQGILNYLKPVIKASVTENMPAKQSK